MKDYVELFVSFFKMGAITFGGGYAMLPILQKEVVEKKHWISNEDVMDYYAVSQGLPGIIAVNVSVFIGYRRKKTLGGIAAALGVVSPCLIIIMAIAAFLANFQENAYVRHAFAGVSVCVAALILNAVLALWKKGVKDALTFVIYILVFCGTEFTSISPIVFIVMAAVVGIIAKTVAQKKGKGAHGQ